uniref:Uncharacterized protein n=1 Tax=Rhinolophus ferrumequinum TaxID=59479 RepID=A0A671ENF9_RHIFE
MSGHQYVSRKQLAGFDKYKCSVADTNPFPLYIMELYSKSITCQLTVCQTSRTQCPTLNWLLASLFLVVTRSDN